MLVRYLVVLRLIIHRVKRLVHRRILNAQVRYLLVVIIHFHRAAIVFTYAARVEDLEVVEFLKSIFLLSGHFIAPFALLVLDVAALVVLVHQLVLHQVHVNLLVVDLF